METNSVTNKRIYKFGEFDLMKNGFSLCVAEESRFVFGDSVNGSLSGCLSGNRDLPHPPQAVPFPEGKARISPNILLVTSLNAVNLTFFKI